LHRVDCLSSHGGLYNYDFIRAKLIEFEAIPEQVKLDKLKRFVTGDDLIEMGYKQSPIFRTILTDIEDRQLENTLVDKVSAIEYIKGAYPIN